MKKVVIDLRSVTKNSDGLGIYSFSFAKRFISQFGEKNQLILILASSQQDIALPDVLEEFDVRVVYSNQGEFNGSYEFDQDQWDSFIASLKPDIYISTAFFSTNHDCLKIVVIHDLVPIITPEILTVKKASFYGKVISESIYNCDLLIAPSNYTLKTIRENFVDFRSDSKVLYPDIRNLINRVMITEDNVEEHGRFLVVGIKCPRKNIELIIQALKILKDENITSCKVYFIGNVREEAVPLYRLIRENFLDDVAEVLGYVPDYEMKTLINGSKGLLFPSQYEGFGMPLVEFLAAKKPIVCTRNTSITEVLDDLVIYCKNSPSAFAESMLRIHNNSAKIDMPKYNERLKKLLETNEAQFNEVFLWIESKLFT